MRNVDPTWQTTCYKTVHVTAQPSLHTVAEETGDTGKRTRKLQKEDNYNDGGGGAAAARETEALQCQISNLARAGRYSAQLTLE